MSDRAATVSSGAGPSMGGASLMSVGVGSGSGGNDDDVGDEEATMWSAELIRRAAADLHLTTSMKQYERRLALRELKDLIKQATEKSSGLLMKPNVSAMLKQGEDTNTNEQFVALRDELSRILGFVEASELRVADSCREIQNCWQVFDYTPLDVLDVMVLGGGAGAAASDMIMESIKLLHRYWVRGVEDRRRNSNNTNSSNNDDTNSGGGVVGDTAAAPGSLGEAIFGSSSSSSSRTSADGHQQLQQQQQYHLPYDEMELTAEYMKMLKNFQVPRTVQTQLFNQLREKSAPVRQLRLLMGTVRANAALPSRERFAGMLQDAAMMIRAASQGAPASHRPSVDVPPPELVDLAEDLVPRLKAWEVAAGFPFFVDKELLQSLYLVAAGSGGGNGDEEGCETVLPSVTTALAKVLAQQQEHSSGGAW